MCQPFAPQLTGPFPTACALLRKPRRSTKFRPMVYLRGGSARCRLYSTFRSVSITHWGIRSWLNIRSALDGCDGSAKELMSGFCVLVLVVVLVLGLSRQDASAFVRENEGSKIKTEIDRRGSVPGPFARHAGSIRLLWSVPIPSHDVLLQDPFDFGDGCRICY